MTDKTPADKTPAKTKRVAYTATHHDMVNPFSGQRFSHATPAFHTPA